MTGRLSIVTQSDSDQSMVALGMTGAMLTPALGVSSSHAAATELLADALLGLPNIVFWVKSRDGRYLAVNQAFADRARCRRPAEAVGLTAGDLFPPNVATACEAQDQRVIASRRPLRNELEVVLRIDGTPGWYLTNKLPQFDESGSPIGTVGVSVDLQKPADDNDVLARLAAVVALVRERFAEPLRVEDLAAEAGMTPLQLERRMRRFLGVSPKQYVRRTRVEEAGRMLTTTNLSIAEIAARCGYYDQSALTAHFKRVTGLAPGEWAIRLGSGRRR